MGTIQKLRNRFKRKKTLKKWRVARSAGGWRGPFQLSPKPGPGPHSSKKRGCVMQAVAVARGLILLALAIFLAADLANLVSRLAGSDDVSSELGHHSNSLHNRDRLAKLTSAVKNSCLPKLICELNASPEKDKLNQKAKTLLQLIRDTSISMTAEVSRYHFAAHMGQLISGVEGTGCHNFYPGCPLPTVKVLSLLNKPSIL